MKRRSKSLSQLDRSHFWDVLRITFACLLGCILVHAQQSKLDSLRTLIQSPTSNKQIDLINELSFELRVSYPDVVTTASQLALSLSRKNNYVIGEIDAHVTLGMLYWLKPEIDRSLEHGLRALHLSDSTDYNKGAMNANLLLGVVYTTLTDFKKAEDFTKKALDLARQLKNSEGMARACNALGNHCRRRNEGNEAMRYYQMGLDQLEGKKIALKNLLLNNIALNYINQDIEREKTKRYLDEALQIALAFENKSAEILTYCRFGSYYTNTEEFALAEAMFIKARDMGIAIGNHSALPEIYKGMADIKTKTGQLDEARAYEVKYLKVKDSIFNLEKVRQVAVLETHAETQRKDQQIKTLEDKAFIERTWKKVLIGCSLLLIAVSYYVFRLQRARTRKILAERSKILVPITSTQELSLDERFLQKLRAIIEANMSDTSFSVEQLAEYAHVNRTQLFRKLKGLTGLSPNDFIKDLRLQKAADMIRQNTDTITQIGYTVGFNDQSYFSKCFKKQFGATPKEFSIAQTKNR